MTSVAITLIVTATAQQAMTAEEIARTVRAKLR